MPVKLAEQEENSSIVSYRKARPTSYHLTQLNAVLARPTKLLNTNNQITLSSIIKSSNLLATEQSTKLSNRREINSSLN